MKIAQSQRIILRTWQPRDRTEAYKFYADPEVSKFIGDGQPLQSLERIEVLLNRFNLHQDQFGFSPWAVVDASSDQVIGICGLHTFNEMKEAELGFRLNQSHWGKGFATEAIQLSLEYAFKNLALRFVSAVTDPENFATQKVLLKSGFSLVGDTIIEGRKLQRYEMQNNEDYYLENGNMVFTKHYHLKRGHCCNSGCRHCPYRK